MLDFYINIIYIQYMKLNNKLKEFREKACMSMRQLSKLSHVSVKTIFDIEHKKKKTRGYNYSTLIQLFSVLQERVPSLKRYSQLYLPPEIKKKKSS